MLCKMCFQEKKLIKAHIVPYCFFRHIKDLPSDSLELLSTDLPYKEKKPKGIYDEMILCDDCEKEFKLYDDYACKLFLQSFNKFDFVFDDKGRKVAYVIKDVNYLHLKLFFMFLLWRASVSSRKEYKITVGPFESDLASMIKKKEAGSEDDFSIIITKFNDFLSDKIWLNPHKTRINGLNFYQFYLGGGYRVYIKVDKRPLEKLGSMSTLGLKDGQPLYILINNSFENSKELQLLMKLVKKKS